MHKRAVNAGARLVRLSTAAQVRSRDVYSGLQLGGIVIPMPATVGLLFLTGLAFAYPTTSENNKLTTKAVMYICILIFLTISLLFAVSLGCGV